MTDFDYQWENLLGKEVLSSEEGKFECNDDRVKEFLKLTGIKPWYKKDSFIKEKILSRCRMWPWKMDMCNATAWSKESR